MVISGQPDWNTRSNMMDFWRPKADDWVNVERVSWSANAYYLGQYFSNDRRTGITKLAYQVAPPEGINPLIMSSTIMVEYGGKILRLLKCYEPEQYHFDIYCLYFNDGKRKPCWVKITNIGDQMLFLHYNGGLSFCANSFSRFILH